MKNARYALAMAIVISAADTKPRELVKELQEVFGEDGIVNESEVISESDSLSADDIFAIGANSAAVGAFIHKKYLDPGYSAPPKSGFPVKPPITPLCPNDRFAKQPAVAYCTGFLVKRNVVLTAKHCNGFLKDSYFVLDFVDPENKRNVRSVFKVKEKPLLSGSSLDYMFVYLEGKAPSAIQPVNLRSTGKIADGARVYTIGHPSGLPKKRSGVEDVAAVIKNSSSHHFFATLDIHKKNSGSPVFNSKTHKVEGIVVSGHSYDPNAGKSWKQVIKCTAGDPDRRLSDKCAHMRAVRITSVRRDS